MSDYKLYNGDCLEVMENLAKDNIKVDLILTDPPYGTTSHKWDEIIPFDDMWNCIHSLSNETTPIVLFGMEPFSSKLRMSNPKEYRYDWIWEKNMPSNIGIARYQPMRYHEIISVFYGKWGQYYKQMIPRSEGGRNRIKYKYEPHVGTNVMGGGDYTLKYKPDGFSELKNPSSIIKVPRVQSNSKEKVPHPSQKPVKLLSYLIKTYTKENQTVLDFTMGSGSTGVACMNLNRNFIGIELEKEYYDIAKERIENTLNPKQQKLI